MNTSSHPALAFLIWLAAILIIPFLSMAGLLMLSMISFLLAPQVWRDWGKLCRRSLWLLLSLWVIVAYYQPGDAWHDLTYAPTDQGILEAWQQCLRLVVMLLCLATLHRRLGHEGLLLALFFFLAPLKKCRLDLQSFVVRVSLVLSILQDDRFRLTNWKDWLESEDFSAEKNIAQPDRIYLQMPPWQQGDSLRFLLFIIVFVMLFFSSEIKI